MDLELEAAAATEAAVMVGPMLRRCFENGVVETRSKAVRQDVVTQADLDAEQAIIGHLRSKWPEDGFLGEESGSSDGTSARVWCVDPLDGTANFAAGYPRWAVAIALLIRGEAVLAVTFDPLREEIFVAREVVGLTSGPGLSNMRAVARIEDALVADNRPYDHREPAQPLEMEFRRSRGRRESGSMALDFAWLAAGRLDVVSYERSERLWDYIGGELLVAQAGGEIRIADPARDIAVAASPELVEYLCPTKDE